jgi:hypothetical protein
MNRAAIMTKAAVKKTNINLPAVFTSRFPYKEHHPQPTITQVCIITYRPVKRNQKREARESNSIFQRAKTRRISRFQRDFYTILHFPIDPSALIDYLLGF